MASSPGFADLRDRILRRAELAPTDEVLDLGSRSGLLILSGAAAAERAWALDVGPSMARHVKTKAHSAGLADIEPVVAPLSASPWSTQALRS